MTAAASSPIGATAVLKDWIARFAAALDRGDIAGAAELFVKDGFWRDLVSFTWNIHTSEGRDEIAEMLTHTLDGTRPSGWQLEGEATEADGVIEGWLAFETELGRGRGYIRLKDGRCWTLLTSLRELKGFEEKRGRARPLGAQHGAGHADRRNWLERKTQEEAELGYARQPYCLIVGGGQGGLGLAARLRQLEVPTIVVDKHPRPGDQWRSRYKSLCLHDPVWYDHMPYLPFPDNWPVFTPKDKIGDWLEMYAKVMELNVWNSTSCISARYDEAKQEWEVEVDRSGERVVLRPKQLILATGMSGVPHMPDYPGMDRFRGQQHHSSQHPGGDAFRGKRVVVVGSNNSAHDICADLWENGADVTMVQRSSTHISRSETLMDVVLGPLYSESAVEAGITAEKADMIFASIPYKIMPDFHRPAFEEVKRRDKDFYERLEKSGFMLDFGDDDSGLFMKYLRRGSGYYIDVGASELIADGKIKLQRGSIDHIEEDGLVLTDGTRLPADVIVYATGFGSMNGWAAKLISQEVADKVGKCWGYGSGTTKDPGPWQGELRNMWKPTRQDGLWFHGGNLHQSRHYSLYLALQLKARMEGLPTPVYNLAETHHRS
ncbi:NAD(P)/FAD-dependent oxidoreductase [Indioceanicola profundi]|uniref:NAD(P)/FAD-dependent oxidoreductase n=1 Tax=Indioceanicola profundi TaxID=2220096 RepID=UPI000E6ABA4F|nr:NAD(P)/FAD-dependent oxidoreductase [Indioceanicola profundi]